ncbi:MAG: Gfo/Idh/MocA family oxidoreductase, partial [Verrucomicrobiota bacterium]
MKITRRRFVAVATTAAIGFPAIVRGQGLNEKLQVAFIATGGKANTHTKECHNLGLQCVAFADVDTRVWNGVLAKKGWEGATGYTDWREMFQKQQKDIDVVFVTTPDHNHFAPTMTALAMGIHCYTEKPLTWSVREAQLLTEAYEMKKDVVTQMGNHGHAKEGWRIAYEYVKGGAVGDVLEFHTWTNRPKWPQGGSRPTYTSQVPEYLNWDAWLGSAPIRPFAAAPEGTKAAKDGRVRGPYHPFNWRGVVDFGAGALGDMACHTTDGIYAIMNPGYAETAEPLEMTAAVDDQYPAGMVVKSTYRATEDRPGFATYWYEGMD